MLYMRTSLYELVREIRIHVHEQQHRIMLLICIQNVIDFVFAIQSIQYTLVAIENKYNNNYCSINNVAYYINSIAHKYVYKCLFPLRQHFFLPSFMIFRFRLLPYVARYFCRLRVNTFVA